MVQQILIAVWCDFHHGDLHAEVPATHTHTVTIDKGAYTVDLCDDCHAAYFAAFASRVAAHSAREGTDPKPPGTKTKPKPKPKGEGEGEPRNDPPRQCLICGEVLPSRSMFDSHAQARHGVRPAEMFGLTCPLCGKTLGNPQALGLHAKHKHEGVGTTPEAFATAAELGDPHGVIEARRAALGLAPAETVS